MKGSESRVTPVTLCGYHMTLSPAHESVTGSQNGHAMDLKDEQTQADCVSRVSDGATYAQVAAAQGVSRSTFMRRIKGMPALKERLDAARIRADLVAHHAPRMGMAPARDDAPAAMATPPEALIPYSRAAFLDLVWRHANDPDSKSGPKALGILAEYELGAEVHAARKAAERAGESDGGTQVRRVNVELPRPGGRVVEVEVVET